MPPVIKSTAPLAIAVVANVIMNAGISNVVIIKPLIAPMKAPIASAANSETKRFPVATITWQEKLPMRAMTAP